MPNLINLITPKNLEEERVKFLASKSYNPTFHYSWQGQKVYPTFEDKVKQKLWTAIQFQDHENISYHASKLFDTTISEELTNIATLAARETGTTHTGTAEEYKKLLDEALAIFGLSHYAVTLVDDGGFNARPQPSRQRILVSKDIHFEFFSMEAGVRHELVHIIRHVNGVYNHIKKSASYLPTEEGLASWCQDHANGDRGRAQHAIEYVGSAIGLRGTLRDIYTAMRELGMSEDLAWKRASRHKFGFVDTSKPGDIIKPAMYFANEQKVESLTTDERLRLFVGKIGLAELREHTEYSGRWEAAQLADYFKLQS